MPQAVLDRAPSADSVSSLSGHSRSSRILLHCPHSEPIDRVLFDCHDSDDESSMAMDSSSTNSDWKSEDEGFDLNNSHDNHNVHPITSTTDNPTDRLQDMHDVAFLGRVQ